MLYHYTKLDTFLAYILPQEELRFSKMGTSKDPKEYKQFSNHIRYTTNSSEQRNFNLFQDTLQEYKRNSLFLCFSELENKGAEIFRYGYDRYRMWDQYGGGNGGICLGFSKDLLLNTFKQLEATYSNPEFRFFREKMKYKNIVRLSRAEYVQRILKDYGNPPSIKKYLDDEEIRNFLFFTKDIDYDDENEYRLLILMQQSNCNISIQIRESLKEITFGDNLSISLRNYYMPILNQTFPNVSLYTMSWDFCGGDRILYNFPEVPDVD